MNNMGEYNSKKLVRSTSNQFTSPLWEQVLEELYSNPPGKIGLLEDDSWEENIGRRTGLRPYMVREARRYLEESGLLMRNSKNIRPKFVLTSEGFKVAHEKEMVHRQQQEEEVQSARVEQINKQYTILTAVLAIIGAVDVVLQAVIGDISPTSLLLLLSVFILIMILIFHSYKELTSV